MPDANTTLFFHKALTMILQGDGQEMLKALQIENPEAQRQALRTLLSEIQPDPVLIGRFQQLADSPSVKATMKAWQQALIRQPELIQDPGFIFTAVADARERRQILRWILHDYQNADERIIAVVRAALEDPDWEVQMTAALVAARLRIRELTPTVSQVKTPHTSKEGLTRLDQQVLRALHQAVRFLLEGAQPPEDADIMPASREAMQGHLLRCAAGLPTRWHDRVFLWTYALTHPIPDIQPPDTTTLPAGVIQHENRYTLAQTHIELIWVPALPHWLGWEFDDLERGKWHPMPNPIRQNASPGYFISRYPLFIKPSDPPPEEVMNTESYLRCTSAEAQHHLAHLSELAETSVNLPTADEWEMATRGPDGRRYAWGNGLMSDMQQLTSPWGMEAAMGIIGQWVTDADTAQTLVCGSPDQPHSALRKQCSPDARNALRIIVKSAS